MGLDQLVCSHDPCHSQESPPSGWRSAQVWDFERCCPRHAPEPLPSAICLGWRFRHDGGFGIDCLVPHLLLS